MEHTPKVAIIVSHIPNAGSYHYSTKLFQNESVQFIDSNQSLNSILKEIRLNHLDICNIQFEYRSFRTNLRSFLLLPILIKLISDKVKVVVTLHGLLVKRSMSSSPIGNLVYSIYKLSIKLSSLFGARFIVHSDEMFKVLNHNYGISTKTKIIPHGSEVSSESFRNHHKRTILFFGFIRPSKGIELLINAFQQLAEKFPEFRLVIAGSLAREEEESYIEHLKNVISKSAAAKNIELKTGFLEISLRDKLVKESFAIVLPYIDNYIEVSGVVHDLAHFGIPIVCTNIPRFSELTDGINCLKVEPNPSSILDDLMKLIEDNSLYNKISEGLVKLSYEERWEIVKNSYFQFFKNLLCD